jgi:hypothetical protein
LPILLDRMTLWIQSPPGRAVPYFACCAPHF